MIDYFVYIQSNKSYVVYCFKGMIQTLRAFIALSYDLIELSEIDQPLFSFKFNQDCVENLFSCVRGFNGHNKHPSVFEFNQIIAKLMSLKVLSNFSSFSNCEADDGENDLCENYDTNSFIQRELNNLNLDEQEKEQLLYMSDTNEENSIYVPTFEANTDVNEIEEQSMRYFAGYVLKQKFKELNCECCVRNLQKFDNYIEPSETFLKNKNFDKTSEIGALIAPSDNFYEVVKYEISRFAELFDVNAHKQGVKAFILSTIEMELKDKQFSYFKGDNPCLSHMQIILSYTVLCLMRKNCKWKCEKDLSKSLKKLNITHRQSQRKANQNPILSEIESNREPLDIEESEHVVQLFQPEKKNRLKYLSKMIFLSQSDKLAAVPKFQIKMQTKL